MTFQYHVAVDVEGRALSAATKRAVVEEFLPADAEIFTVDANNAFEARRAAVALWAESRPAPAPGA
jgi:hypothetical protein